MKLTEKIAKMMDETKPINTKEGSSDEQIEKLSEMMSMQKKSEVGDIKSKVFERIHIQPTEGDPVLGVMNKEDIVERRPLTEGGEIRGAPVNVSAPVAFHSTSIEVKNFTELNTDRMTASTHVDSGLPTLDTTHRLTPIVHLNHPVDSHSFPGVNNGGGMALASSSPVVQQVDAINPTPKEILVAQQEPTVFHHDVISTPIIHTPETPVSAQSPTPSTTPTSSETPTTPTLTPTPTSEPEPISPPTLVSPPTPIPDTTPPTSSPTPTVVAADPNCLTPSPVPPDTAVALNSGKPLIVYLPVISVCMNATGPSNGLTLTGSNSTQDSTLNHYMSSTTPDTTSSISGNDSMSSQETSDDGTHHASLWVDTTHSIGSHVGHWTDAVSSGFHHGADIAGHHLDLTANIHDGLGLDHHANHAFNNLNHLFHF